MKKIEITASQLLLSLLNLSKTENISLLDSCGVGYLDSHFLIAGIRPVETLQITNSNPFDSLQILCEKLKQPETACIFTISYDFGLKLEKIKSRKKEFESFPEPDFFLSIYDCLIIHNYSDGNTFITGNEDRFSEIAALFDKKPEFPDFPDFRDFPNSLVTSNFTRQSYINTIEKIKEHIRRGDTYQANLTQQIRANLPAQLTPQNIFRQLRKSHPAAFSAFLQRKDDSVISISPERFFKVGKDLSKNPKSQIPNPKSITVSPIKGTRPRGEDPLEDVRLKNELLKSEKDRAENIMIVDLLRNDIGRICKFGSVEVEKLCALEEHPTLFHLVSTIRGELTENIDIADIIKAVFPCGSITGAPKIRTMRIIDELETANRGLSMGAIGCHTASSRFQTPNSIDMSVAIRTMVIRGNEAVFNVGGGIVIDSQPELEFEESLLKAKAILNVIKGELV